MSDAVIVALIGAIGLFAGQVLIYRQARSSNQNAQAANKAVNGVGEKEPPLVKKVDSLAERLEHSISEHAHTQVAVETLQESMGEGLVRLRNVERGLDHVAEQAASAAVLAAAVKDDLVKAHHRAEAVPDAAEAGSAADAAFKAPDFPTE